MSGNLFPEYQNICISEEKYNEIGSGGKKTSQKKASQKKISRKKASVNKKASIAFFHQPLLRDVGNESDFV